MSSDPASTPLPAEVTDRLRGLQPLVILSGAGISAESGLATFRGPGGLWEGRPALRLATPEAFRSDPETVWRFYVWRREQARLAKPNSAHRALAALEREGVDVTVVTQNVDGLHERAGSARIVRLHGSLSEVRCADDSCRLEHRGDFEGLPPRCRCGSHLRPGVVWFGEPLPREALDAAVSAATTARAFWVVGTSAAVEPAASLPRLARAHGALVVEINPEPTALTAEADVHIGSRAAEAVPALVAAAYGSRR